MPDERRDRSRGRGPGRRWDRRSHLSSPAWSSTVKARLQGRRGPTPLQPYREFRRLWGKSSIDVEGDDGVVPAAPLIVVAALTTAILLVPVADRAPGWVVGHDALALVGLLALARFAIATAAWDAVQRFFAPGSEPRPPAFGLRRGDARALARGRGTRDRDDRPARGDRGHGRRGCLVDPGARARATAFALVVSPETGRQPVDNPDTHLELTMIHEGLCSSSGAATSPCSSGLPLRGIGSCSCSQPRCSSASSWDVVQLARCRSCYPLWSSSRLWRRSLAKMRILLVPRLIGVGAAVALLGIVTWLVDAR